MKIINSLRLVILLFPFFIFSQTTVLCPIQETYFKIEDSANIPSVAENGDGTITLTHTESYITDIFANYIIYDFYQAYPSSSGELFKYYNIAFKTKDLINELQSSISTDIFLFDYFYESTPISNTLINFLDGKTLKLTKYCSIADNTGEPCPEQNVPEGFDLKVVFNYNSTNDLLVLETIGLTPCGNSFSIALRGGTVAGTLQLWETTPSTISETNDLTCLFIEQQLFTMFDIACDNYNYGDLIPTINTENNTHTLFLYRQNMVFGYNTLTFEEENLSIEENNLESIKLISNKDNPYITFSNIDNDSYFIEIFSVLGTRVLDKIPFKKNKISTSNLANGLHFIKLTNNNNQSKVYKFLKM